MALIIAGSFVLFGILCLAALFDIQSNTRKSRIALESLVSQLSQSPLPQVPHSSARVYPSQISPAPPPRPYTPSAPRKRPGDATQPLEP